MNSINEWMKKEYWKSRAKYSKISVERVAVLCKRETAQRGTAAETAQDQA